MKSTLFVVRTVMLYAALSIACFLMLRSIAGYAAFRDDVQFLLLKQDYLNNTVWKTAFYIHTFSAVIALFAGFTQFSSSLLREHRALHRWLGRLYVVNILLINVPAGLIMALYANGGLWGKSAFLLLDGLWFFFTWRAYACARHKDFVRHRQHILRSYALTLSAITLRLWKSILSITLDIDPGTLYVIDAWLGFIPNLLVAEWLIRRPAPQPANA